MELSIIAMEYSMPIKNNIYHNIIDRNKRKLDCLILTHELEHRY